MAPLVRTGGSCHTGLAALPHHNIQDAAAYFAGKLIVRELLRLPENDSAGEDNSS